MLITKIYQNEYLALDGGAKKRAGQAGWVIFQAVMGR